MNLNIGKELLCQEGKSVVGNNKDLVLRAHGDKSGFISFKDKHIGCVVCNEGRTYLPESEELVIYRDKTMLVEESESNIDISFITNEDLFNYVFEKTALDSPLHFELNKKRFTLAKEYPSVRIS